MSQNILSNLSWIQRHIMIELTRHSWRRYSQLCPSDVEGNVFMYHLKGLMGAGLVEKAERQYRLTPKGKQYVTTLSLVTGKARTQPMIVNALIATNEQQEYLLSRWHREPNTGLVSFPHGMMHYGASLLDMAALELAEKAGLVATISYRGEVLLRVMNQKEVIRHMLVHLFDAKDVQPGRQNEMRPDASQSFWARLSTVPKEEFMPGFWEIAQLIDKHPAEQLFADIVVSGEL